MANLQLKNINKVYDNNVQAVFDFNLDINDHDFIVFVGPSGCGKSTTLRMIAGLEEITSGDFYIDDVRMNDIAPKDRNIAMVFQSYALYPHMSVADNMGFGLKIQKVEKAEIERRVSEAAEILELTDYLQRKPKALSGGQRQRVALGRAIVRNAKVFLMDEPLSNLDAKLRVQMRSEIIRLHERLHATTIYVTHDQTEAMTMADRIVVMKDGYIQQIGTPKEIYDKPANTFVASFIGAPAMNFVAVTYADGYAHFDGKKLRVPEMFLEKMNAYEGKDVILGIRPEDLHYEDIVVQTYPDAIFDYEAEVCELLGHEFILHGKIGNVALDAKVPSRLDVRRGDVIQLAIDCSKIHFFDAEKALLII